MRVNAYLNFDGRCAAALAFYERHLGAKVEAKMTWNDQPGGCSGDLPAGWHDKIMHAQFTIGENVLMASDSPPNYYEPPKGITIVLNLENTGEADRIFAALSEGGSVRMPLEKTFWAEKFGMVVDQFGIPWMINCMAASQVQAPNKVAAAE